MPSEPHAFSAPTIRNFNKEVLRTTTLYKDTTATAELKAKYKADWLTIEKKINEYEAQLEATE